MKIPTFTLTVCFAVLLLALAAAPPAAAQENSSAKGREVYDQIKAAAFAGGAAEAKGLVLKRDRAEMTFDGTFYFASPVEGRVTGAVFVGRGKFRADVPPSDFERENVKRLLGAEAVESDFKTAVLRFSDDTFETVGHGRVEAPADERARRLAVEVESRLLRETGVNLSARLAASILNGERPGFFFATFDGGSRDRFSLVLDHQTRLPAAHFGLNGGEKGVVFAYKGVLFGNDVWMAFFSLADYERRMVAYSDQNELLDTKHYDIALDLRDPGRSIRLVARLKAEARFGGVRAVPFQVGESLGEQYDERKKKQMRVKAARAGGAELAFVQEDWEGGLTVFLPAPASAGQAVELELELEGDFMTDSRFLRDCFYPSSNTAWYPRHGYLDRATFDLTFRHRKNRRVAAAGARLAEQPDPDDKDAVVTRYSMPHPVPVTTFAIGPFERHSQTVKWEKGWEPIQVEFNSLPGNYGAIKEDFILAELDNSLRYFSLLFGKYSYPTFNAVFHPFGFGQGLPGLLTIPDADRASKHTYAFIAHETAHQWWGDIVTWRSYRDQWLSEGFAEYSGVLYTGIRESLDARADLVGIMRRSLKNPPVTTTGVGGGRLVDVGPIILGHRLNTSKTYGAYRTLIYNKGALVLRMLHFLMTDPSSGKDEAFFALMTDFVERHRDGFASTDDFRAVAGEHFARTPIARKYGLKDLNWFFHQWVYQTGLPSYKLEYQIEPQPDGTAVLRGAVMQENVPEKWFMPLPLVLTFGEKQWATGTVHAYGPKTPFEIKLPRVPKKAELDPHHWVLSEGTSTKGR
ncbi:MAG TPA: M1 family aminopeptidase [Pyrinomonadaceae bacterium]|nr:M1 family aminopeptidase [Pyrinomonadaceae bacterium]